MKQTERTDSSFSSHFTSLDPDQIKEVASGLAEEAAGFIRKHPLESVGAALVAGLLLGLFINRK